MLSTKGKSCQTDLVAFWNKVKEVDEGILTLSVWTSGKALDTVSKWEKHGFDKCTTWWVRNWLGGCTQGSIVNDSGSKWKPVVLLRDQYWDRCCSAVTWTEGLVHAPQVCCWHQTVLCGWHAGGNGCHPERAGLRDVLMQTSWVQQWQMQGPARGSGHCQPQVQAAQRINWEQP